MSSSWYSILPPSLGYIETVVSYICISLGLLTIGPWLLLLAYDMALYTYRSATHEAPDHKVAEQHRPRAPSLSRRPAAPDRRGLGPAFAAAADFKGFGGEDGAVGRGARNDSVVGVERAELGPCAGAKGGLDAVPVAGEVLVR